MANVPADILALGEEAIRAERWRNGDLSDAGLARVVLEAAWARVHGSRFGEAHNFNARVERAAERVPARGFGFQPARAEAR